MEPYLIIARFPKNPKQYIKNFTRYILKECEKREIDCVVERITGRIIVFSETNPCALAERFKNVLRCTKIKIFMDPDKLAEAVAEKVRKASSFAVHSNHLAVAQDIGERIYEDTHTPVNIENPEVLVEVEYRDGMYLLFLH